MNWSIALPELVLAVCAMGVLVFGVIRRQDSTVLCTMLTLGAMLLGGVLVVGGQYGVGYHGQFSSDAFSAFVKVLILAGAAFALVLSLDYNEKEGLARFEYPVLVLLAVVGMMVMASATNLMTLYLGLELQSLALYVLAAFARDTLRSSEAGLKYFVLGALASGLLLYGISLVYGFSGSMDFNVIARALTTPTGVSAGLVVGIVFIIAGLAFKISAVPFHMWTPDVYEGAPTAVTALLGTAPKVAAIALILRVMVTPFGHLLPQWQLLIELVSIASMVLGSLAAIGQTSIKRLMAYSSIGHMGYALIGLAAGTEAGVRGVLVYMIVYVFMNLSSFACIIAMRRQGRPVEKIADLAGLARTDPGLALVMAVAMFSMAGIPPLSGFFGKLYVFLAAIQAGLITLAVIGVLTSVIGAYYYIRIVKLMYFDAPEGAVFDRRSPSLSFVAAVTGLFTTFFFVFPAPFVGAAAAAAKVLFGVSADFWRLRVFPSIDSTSDLCATLAATGEPEGLAVMALRQTAGRGSRGRQWESPVGNLYISVLLRPSGKLAEGGRWALLAGVALADAIAPLLPDPGVLALKWPNDVLLDGRKLAGILVDATAKTDGGLDWLVIGCGVNLAAAPTLPGRRTVCLAEFAAAPPPEAMAARLLDRLLHWRNVRTAEGFGPVRAAWLTRAQPVGSPVQLAYNGGLLAGTFAGLADDGSLLLATGGRVDAFATGEILLQADRPAGG